eukprot:359844_1
MSLLSTDVTFVNETAAKAYECGICLEMLKNPVAICDDHLFCQECVVQLIQREGDHFKCPNCRKICNVHQVKRTTFIDRLLGELVVKCPNFEITRQKALYLQSIPKLRRKSNYNKNPSERLRSRSRSRDRKTKSENAVNVNNKVNSNESCAGLCNWTGQWSNLQKHINECKLHAIKCEYCHILMMRQATVNHNSICADYPIPCQMCNLSISRTKMNGHLIRYCQSWIVDCNYCHKKMKRGEIINHSNNECPESLIRCKYSANGCDKILHRKDEKKHMREGMNQHLRLITQSHDEMKFNMQELQNKVNSLENTIEEMKDEHTNRFESLEEKYTTLLDCIMD